MFYSINLQVLTAMCVLSYPSLLVGWLNLSCTSQFCCCWIHKSSFLDDKINISSLLLLAVWAECVLGFNDKFSLSLTKTQFNFLWYLIVGGCEVPWLMLCFALDWLFTRVNVYWSDQLSETDLDFLDASALFVWSGTNNSCSGTKIN